jgi:hypothetical protein
VSLTNRYQLLSLSLVRSDAGSQVMLFFQWGSGSQALLRTVSLEARSQKSVNLYFAVSSMGQLRKQEGVELFVLSESQPRTLSVLVPEELLEGLSRQRSLPLLQALSESPSSLSLSDLVVHDRWPSQDQDQLQPQMLLQAAEARLFRSINEALKEKYHQGTLSGEELQQSLINTENSTRNLMLLGASAFFSLICLLLLLRLRAQIAMPLTGQLICFLPEECVAELSVFRQRLQSQKRSELLIRLLLLCCIIQLFWAFYICIQIDNLCLPSNKKIDD